MTRQKSIGFLSAVFLATLLLPLTASALVHVARSGENLKQLADRYYGNRKFSMIIRAANGFLHPDNGRLLPGEMVEIPEVTYHRVSVEDTWKDLAARLLGTPRRASFLAEINNMKPDDDALVEGKIIVIPYQLLYVLAPDETLKDIAKFYLGKKFTSKWLRNYNLKKKKKYNRGDALIIPLVCVELTPKERAKKKNRSATIYSKEDRSMQITAAKQLSGLRDDFDNGRYMNIVTTAQRLIGTGRLTKPQQIGIYKFLAFAYVAFNEQTLARAAFKKALDLQPGMDLSPITTSPKILNVFKEACELPANTDEQH